MPRERSGQGPPPPAGPQCRPPPAGPPAGTGQAQPVQGSGRSSRGQLRRTRSRPVPSPHLLPRLVEPPQPLLQLPPVAPRRLDALPSLLQEEPHLGLGAGGLHGQPRQQRGGGGAARGGAGQGGAGGSRPRKGRASAGRGGKRGGSGRRPRGADRRVLTLAKRDVSGGQGTRYPRDVTVEARKPD